MLGVGFRVDLGARVGDIAKKCCSDAQVEAKNAGVNLTGVAMSRPGMHWSSQEPVRAGLGRMQQLQPTLQNQQGAERL